MRIWKRSLYVWGGEEISSSCNTSICSDSEHDIDEAEDRGPVLADKVRSLVPVFFQRHVLTKNGILSTFFIGLGRYGLR